MGSYILTTFYAVLTTFFIFSISMATNSSLAEISINVFLALFFFLLTLNEGKLSNQLYLLSIGATELLNEESDDDKDRLESLKN